MSSSVLHSRFVVRQSHFFNLHFGANANITHLGWFNMHSGLQQSRRRKKIESRSRIRSRGAAIARLPSYDCVVLKLEIDFAAR